MAAPLSPLVTIATFIDGKPIAQQRISQPIKQLTQDIRLLTKELKKAQGGSPYHWVEIVHDGKQIRLSRQQVEQILIATHGPTSAFDVYTKAPKGKPFPFRTTEAQERINKLLETREQAKTRKAHLYFSPTPIGSIMDENISRARALLAAKN